MNLGVFIIVFWTLFGAIVGGGLLIAEIVDNVRAKKARKEGLFVYRYPF